MIQRCGGATQAMRPEWRSRRALRIVVSTVLAALVATLALPAGAQIGEAEIAIVELDASSYPEVEVIVDVPQSFAGTTLTGRQFSLQEGGVAREIDVRKLEDTTAVVLAIDTSGSMSGEPLQVAKNAAIAFLEGLPDRNPVAVVGFGDDVLVASPLTTDRQATTASVQALASAGETSLFDALVSSAALFDTSNADRFAMVLLSDGADTASSATSGGAVAALLDKDITLYAVGLETGDSRLTELASISSGAEGRYLPAADLAQLAAVYDDLAARLANQYELRFLATSAGPVEVRVNVAGDDGGLASTITTTELAPATGAAVDPLVPQADAPPSLQVSPLEPSVNALSPGLLQSGNVFLAGILALFFTFSVIAYSVFSMTRSQPTRRGLEPRAGQQDRKLSGVADWASSVVDRMFLDGRRRGAMNAALDRAGLNVRPGEFIVLTACVAIAVFVVGWVVHPLVGLVLGAGVALSARFVVAYMGSRRRKLFSNQLDNTLLVLASSLRAGHGIQRALAAVAEESESPTNEEFTRVVAETRIGRDLIEALQGVADRLGNDDFEWVVRAVAINRELGGNLSEVLDNVGNTIRERNQLRRQVQALSAEGRLSAMVLYVLPFGVAAFVKTSNPGYIGELTESTAGLVMIVGALLAMVGGGVWIKKIVSVRF